MTDGPVSINDAARLYAKSCLRGFEGVLFERMKNPDLDILAEFAQAFRINRQFPRDAGPKRYAKVLAFMKKNDCPADTEALILQVNCLAEDAGTSTNIKSAASKFVWARHPMVGIIIDSRAQKSLTRQMRALKIRGGRAGEYAVHVERWNHLYRLKQEELNSAAEEHDLSEPWAARRLLDYWLYKSG